MRGIPTLLTFGAAVLAPASAMAITEPPSTSDPGDGPDVVVQITYEGGLLPLEIAFVNPPALFVTDDGRIVVPGPIPEIHPGPLVPVFVQRTISEDGVQAYLDLAEEHELFEDRSYARNPLVADAPSTVVRIRVGEEEYVHSAYALGIQDETDPDRAQLLEFVNDALDPAAVAGPDTLGDEEPFETESFLVFAYESDPSDAGTDPEPSVVDWPTDASVRLADAAVCAEVPYDDVADVLAGATQVTWFEDDGVTYRVAAVPQLPGREC